MKMLIAAIRFFRADDIRPYNDRNSFSVCSCFCRKIAISDCPVAFPGQSLTDCLQQEIPGM
ncbi:MAG: hypothetical protein IJS41_03595, partial [Clostridia bacterium]|nr:hypothetical protein [Clostridia bacterium]